MPGNFHGWMVVKNPVGPPTEVFNQARSAAYLSNPALTPNGIDICDITEFGGCENYAMVPYCVGASKGNVDFPGTAGNYASVTTALPSDPSAEVRVEFIRPPNPTGSQIFSPSYIPFYIRFQGPTWTGVVSVNAQIYAADGTYPTATAAVSSLVGFPGVGQRVQMRLVWTAGTDTLTLDWRRSTVPLTDNTLAWQAAASSVNAGKQLMVSPTLTLWNLTHDGLNAMFGKVYRWLLYVNGALTHDINAATDVKGDTATFVATTGQTVTVYRTGTPATMLTPELAAYETWDQLTFNTPALDPAPWYNEDYPESADALGFWVEEWTGLDDRHVQRQMIRTGRDRGGAAVGVIGNRERVMKLNVLMIATTEEAMMYQFHWLAATLESVCSSCTSDTILIRDYCGEAVNPAKGLVEMRDVALIEGLGWESDIGRRGRCFIRRASFTLAAGDPCMYISQTDPRITTIPATLGAGLLTEFYNPTRKPPRPSCSELSTTTRASYSWPSESAMGVKAPVVTFTNDNAEHAFPFRAILYHDPWGGGAAPNPCGLSRVGEIYVRPLPPYGSLRWDVAGREIEYSDATTGGWVAGWPYIDANDTPLQRYFVLPCAGDHHLVLEPATLAIERVGTIGNVFEWNGIVFSNPHYPDVTISIVERVGCA